ncbi:MAG: signal peptidase I [Armatimonadota bacterium]|nr:signal peptidase I [Armatimonadota bacterium]MCX7776865.1 signal peptidase I [Armatimonadota bacterium]MDW8024449.1 signal peptidase I [Armatimonadota bacterium]
MRWELLSSPLLWGVVIAALIVIRVALAFISWDRFELLRKQLSEIVEALLFALALVMLIIRPFIVHAFHIPSSSMSPTLEVNDKILVGKFLYRFREPRRQEVVVFEAPPEALRWSAHQNQTTYIKRVIGIPNDLIRIERGQVFINGERLNEPYVHFRSLENFPDDFGDWVIDPKLSKCIVVRSGKRWVRVPKDCYFVMGDNRSNSSDSRRWGFVKRERMQGKALFRWWPLWRIGLVR